MAIALSGSLILSGSITVSGSIISTGTISMSGSIASASYANNATSASYANNATSASYALNATTGAYANTATSASYALNATTFNGLASSIFATTGSNTFIGTQTITGSVLQSGSFTTTGTIIAQTINVQQVTSSIVYSCGSNIFGTSISNTQQLTGSVGITGSLTIAGASSATSYNGATIFGSTIACSPIGCFATSCATSFIGGTMSGTTIYGSTAVCAPVAIFSGCVGIGTTSPAYRLDVRQVTTNPVAFFGFSQTSSSSNGLIKLNSGRIPQGGSDFTGESGIIFGHSGGTGGVNFDGQGGYIKSIRLNTYAASGESDSALVFATALDNVDYERMRITSTGNIGIGTCTPGYLLDICTTQSIRVIGSSTGYTQGSIIFQSSTTNTPEARGLGVYAFNEGTDATWFYGTAYNAGDSFAINRKSGTTYQDAAASIGEACNFLLIKNNGNVGIGTTVGTAGLGIGGTGQTTANLTDAGSRTAIIEILPTGGAAGNGGALVLGSDTWGTGAGRGQIALKALLTNGSGCGTSDLAFSLRNDPSCSNLTERMRITVDGNVGIGTSPGSILHVKGGTVGGADFGAELRVWENSFGAVLQGFTYGTTAAFLGNFRYNINTPASSVTNYYQAGHGILFHDGVHILSSNPGGTSGGAFTPAKRLTVTNSGAVCLSSSIRATLYCMAPNGTNQVYSIVDSDATYAGNWSWQAGGGSAGYGGSVIVYGHSHATRPGFISAGISAGSGGKFTVMSSGNGSGSDVFTVNASGLSCFAGTVCAPCFATISDYRMKSNVRPIEGLSIIMNTKPYKFEYNYDCSTSFGMIAHELQDTLPEAVFGQKDGEVMQGVDYMKLLPITIKAIQEQQCTICSQASMINTLKTCLGII